MSFTPLRNLEGPAIAALVRQSKYGAVRRVRDPRTGDFWYWRCEQATHAQGARRLGIPYDPYGGGEVLILTEEDEP